MPPQSSSITSPSSGLPSSSPLCPVSQHVSTPTPNPRRPELPGRIDGEDSLSGCSSAFDLSLSEKVASRQLQRREPFVSESKAQSLRTFIAASSLRLESLREELQVVSDPNWHPNIFPLPPQYNMPSSASLSTAPRAFCLAHMNSRDDREIAREIVAAQNMKERNRPEEARHAVEALEKELSSARHQLADLEGTAALITAADRHPVRLMEETRRVDGIFRRIHEATSLSSLDLGLQVLHFNPQLNHLAPAHPSARFTETYDATDHSLPTTADNGKTTVAKGKRRAKNAPASAAPPAAKKSRPLPLPKVACVDTTADSHLLDESVERVNSRRPRHGGFASASMQSADGEIDDAEEIQTGSHAGVDDPMPKTLGVRIPLFLGTPEPTEVQYEWPRELTPLSPSPVPNNCGAESFGNSN
ncbi:hypothetical protein B0H11DRAFT_2386582 [Mycena galericulata]|nr:hypothetical protein B0H11DRAFT_2386582 [Mycena galericulata]